MDTKTPRADLSVLWSVDSVHENWVYGSFQLKVGDSLIGDAEDYVALNAVFNWTESYLSDPIEIDSATLDEMSKEETVKTYYDPYMSDPIFPEDQHPQVYGRMPTNYISYLGMSALDQWMLLCFNRESYQRLVWADLRDGVVEEAFLEPQTLQTALKEALKEYKSRVG